VLYVVTCVCALFYLGVAITLHLKTIIPWKAKAMHLCVINPTAIVVYFWFCSAGDSSPHMHWRHLFSYTLCPPGFWLPKKRLTALELTWGAELNLAASFWHGVYALCATRDHHLWQVISLGIFCSKILRCEGKMWAVGEDFVIKGHVCNFGGAQS
jgi:hypothetical protein